MSTLEEPCACPPAGASGGPWQYVSASRLNLWLKCPWAWRLKYIDRVPETPTPSLLIGQMTHQGLERLYRRRQLGLPTPLEHLLDPLAADWEEALQRTGVSFVEDAERVAAREQVARLLTAYWQQVPPDEPLPWAVETSLSSPLVDPFTGEDLGVPLVGVVDLILGGGDGPLICDFKTVANSVPPLEITHEVQLSIYSYLFRSVSGQREGGLEIRALVKTKSPRVIAHRYAPRQEVHLRRLFALLRAYLDDLDRGQYLCRPGWGCGWCAFRGDHCGQWCG